MDNSKEKMKTLKDTFFKLKPEERLHCLQVPVIALTGGIATGKSTVANILIQKTLPLIDADALVKSIYSKDETIHFIKNNFPTCIKDERINFPLLREMFFKDPNTKEIIESFIYKRLPGLFIQAYQKLGSPPFIIYDVPLLFERNLDILVDFKILVYAPRNIQLERLVQRDHLSVELAETILNQQMDIEIKKTKSDYVLKNTGTKKDLEERVCELIEQLFDYHPA